MQNRFGLKDLLFLLLLLGILLSVWLSMVQKTRLERMVRGVADTQTKLESQMARLDMQLHKAEDAILEIKEGLAQGVVIAGGAGQASASPAGAAATDAWARPGVPIQRFPVPGLASDPSTLPGFRVGGNFTEIFEAQPAKVVPYISQDVYGRRVTDQVCESLGQFDPNTLQLVGQLAAAWQIDPDGMWIRARLHPRARFSDGHPVTADDVIFTFKDYVMNPSIEAEVSRSIMDNLVDVVRIDDLTVEFQFSGGLFNNTLNALRSYILPKHYYSQFEPAQINQSTGLLMGSGAFRMERLPSSPTDIDNQWRPGTDVVLVRNEQHWAIRPPLEKLRYKVVTEEMARFVAYTNGEGDMMLPQPVQFRKVLSEDPEFERSNYALNWVNMRSGYSFIGWQCGLRAGKTPTPFADVRVRRAMTMLLDREQMIRDIYENVGVVAKGPMNPESPASNPALKPLPYDPVAAQKLLAEAGWIDRDGDGILENEQRQPFTFEFTRAVGGATHERMTEFIRQSFAKAGILMTVRVVDWSRYTEILKLRDFDALTMGWSANAPESDPRQIWHSESMKEGGNNFVQWSSDEVDALIDQGRQEMDFNTRQLIWHKLEAAIADGQAYTFVRVVPWLRFVKRDIGNVQTYKTGLAPEEFFRLGPGSVATPN